MPGLWSSLPRPSLGHLGWPIVAVYFLYSAWGGLFAHLSTDDLMNLHGYWLQPWWRLMSDQILYCNAAYRPMGALFYLPLFSLFGLESLPYRTVAYLLLAANLYLLAKFVRNLQAPLVVALAACLIACYHPALAHIYHDSGTIYDVLCFFFYFGALCLYTGLRSTGGLPNRRETLLLALLYVAALNSKEMAVSLPVVLLAYEFLYHPPREWNSEFLTRWLRQGQHAILLGLMTVPYIVGKLSDASVFAGIEAYQPDYSLHRFLANYAGQLQQLFYLDDPIPEWGMATVLVALLALAVGMKSRVLGLCWVLMVVGFVPIAFIAPRGAYAFYLPLAGWSVCIAVLLWAGCRLILRPILEKPRAARLLAAEAGFLLLAAVLLLRAHRVERSWVASPGKISSPGIGMQRRVHSTLEQLKTLAPSAPRGARILFLDDPFGPDYQTLTQLCQLLYRDPTLVVDRTSVTGTMPASQYAGYDHVVRFDGDALTSVLAPGKAPRPSVHQ